MYKYALLCWSKGGDTVDKLLLLSGIAGSVTSICACLCLFMKPIRNKLPGLNDIRDGQKCLLRGEMLHTYYKHHEENHIRQYEYENFIYSYKAYKALGGNSFIDKIYREVQDWEVYT